MFYGSESVKLSVKYGSEFLVMEWNQLLSIV